MGTRSPRAEVFQFTHPVWGATTSSHLCVYPLGVSIHAPRVGCDHEVQQVRLELRAFQFTHPVWGATSISSTKMSRPYGFNSRTPCGVRRCSPRRGCTLSCFNSRTPCGVRQHIALASTKPMSFNSRTPCGVRHEVPQVRLELRAFQFTHPVWGATGYAWIPKSALTVSIHAPRVGCDCRILIFCQRHLTFQFTHPVWGATGDGLDVTNHESVSIHAPRVGCDTTALTRLYSRCCFNSRTPCGVRHHPTHRRA